MWWKIFLSYFSYTKKERTGIYVLITVVLLLWIIPYFFSADIETLPPAEITVINNAVSRIDSNVLQQKTFEPVQASYTKQERADKFLQVTRPFPFDPNITTEQEWEELGLNRKTVSIIRNYIKKGGRFRKPEDLKKVYGFNEHDYERLAPFIRIKEETTNRQDQQALKNDFGAAWEKRPPIQPKENKKIDINQAEVPDWENLQGIGQKLAARIVLFREKLGGFHSIDQVGNTYGLNPETFAVIKPQLIRSDSYSLKRLDINKAAFDELKQHPYIGGKLASLIISYRNAHAGFKDLEELKLIPVVTDEQFALLKPYLTLSLQD